VATTTSGELSSARSWSTTAASMLAADTRRISVSLTSPFSAAWQT
jgi:hypothetical protein